MKKNVFRIFLVVLLLAGFNLNAVAFQEEADGPPTKENMEKVRKRIETLKMWKLTQALDLDEKTSAQVFPILSRHDKNRSEAALSFRNGMRELRESLRDKREIKLKNILDKIDKAHKALQNNNDEEWTEVKKILTIEQQAKFLIFQQEFERDIRNIIAEAREKRGPGRGEGTERGDFPRKGEGPKDRSERLSPRE